MKKTVLVFGLISGAIAAAVLVAMIPFLDTAGYRQLEVVGYSALVLSALMVFFGIRSYRENVGGGRLSFGRGLAVGTLIALVSSLCYITAFELANFVFVPDLGDRYAACMIRHAREKGATEETMRETEQQAEMFKKMWSHPLGLAAVSFAESFPIGFAVSLISAGLLRRRPPVQG